jgi:hypothetical protein
MAIDKEAIKGFVATNMPTNSNGAITELVIRSVFNAVLDWVDEVNGEFGSNNTISEVNSFNNILNGTRGFVLVRADETNGNEATLYFNDGSNIHWVPTIII